MRHEFTHAKHLSSHYSGKWFKTKAGKLLGQKPPLKLTEIWEIRIRVQLSNNLRELALFNMAINSKLRACGLFKLKVRNIIHGDQILKWAMVMQQKDPSAGAI